MRARSVFLVASLVLVLIGVAYVKAIYSSQGKNKGQTPSGNSVEPGTVTDVNIFREDIGGIIDSLRTYYTDSIYSALSDSFAAEMTAASDAPTMDSLTAEIRKLRGTIDGLNKDIASLKSGRSREFEKLVYTFYLKELDALPNDLSDYEKQVSIKEIKGKARQYFDVSAKTLDLIIKKYR